MPTTSSAKKALRSSMRKRGFNQARADALRFALREVKKAISRGKSKEAHASLSLAYKAIDKAAKRGVIKKQAAARKKSRLAKMVKAVPVK